MLGVWLPRYTCGRDCNWYGKSNPPRLVSAKRDNYILNAPGRFFCAFCLKNAKDQKALGVPKKERDRYSYLLTCYHILEKLNTENLDVYLMFPYNLTKRAAIDN